jgi:hypothetical protein
VSNDLVQAVLDIIFSKYMLFLAPMIFLFMAALFADRIIEIIFNSIDKSRWK